LSRGAAESEGFEEKAETRIPNIQTATIETAAATIRKTPKVAVAALLIRNGKVLLGKRKGSHGEGDWCIPGGHMEVGEELEGAARREVFEETGIRVERLKLLSISNEIIYGKHFVTVGFLAENFSGEPRVAEPDRCEGWGWFDLKSLPSPIFVPSLRVIQSYLTGKMLWDVSD